MAKLECLEGYRDPDTVCYCQSKVLGGRLRDKAKGQNAPVTPRQYIIGVCYCPYSAVSRATGLM